MNWTWLVDLGLLSLAILFASILRKWIPILRTLRVPIALLAGFLLLPIYELAGFSRNVLEAITFHCFNLSFIAIILRKPQKFGTQVLANTTAVFMQYALQGFFGLCLTYLLASTLFPNLSLGFGLLLPLGFALGPGPAFSLGKTFELLGFQSAATLGVFMASVGYLVASIIGIILIYWARKKNLLSSLGVNNSPPDADPVHTNREKIKQRNDHQSNASAQENTALDILTLHSALVLFVYVVTYLFLQGLTSLMQASNIPALAQLAETLWGLTFLFSALWALIIRSILQLFRVTPVFNNQYFTRINGLTMDFVIVVAVASISFSVIAEYWLSLTLLSILGILIVIIPLLWMCSRLFKDHIFPRTLVIFGVSSGTLSIALALLRIVDPGFKTPVASDYMYSMGFNFLFSIPFILSLNTAIQSRIGGDTQGFFIMLGVCACYAITCFILFRILAGKRTFHRPNQIWYTGTRL